MRTSKFYFAFILCFMAACTVAKPTKIPPIASVLATNTGLPTLVPGEITAPKVASTRTPLAAGTATPGPTATATGGPQWFARAEAILDWPKDATRPYWLDEQTLSFYGYPNDTSIIRVMEDGVSSLQALTPPEFLKDLPEDSYRYSPNKTYVAVCEQKEADRYHRLTLYRTTDAQLLGQVDSLIMDCGWQISWAADESALSFYDEEIVHAEGWIDIFVWKTDGSDPYLVGLGNLNFPLGQVTWSPDGQHLAVVVYDPPRDMEYEYTYRFLYADGRPEKDSGATCSGNTEGGLSWVTEDIVYQTDFCCGSCRFSTYYVAETGEQIPDLYWENCYPTTSYDTQSPSLSPDQRWFVVDRTDQDFIDLTAPFRYAYTLYDFQTHQPYVFSTSEDVFIEFVGWSADSSRFYLIRHPANQATLEQPDAPFGLLSLDPLTRQLTLIDPAIHAAWLSPDGHAFFGITKANDTFSGAIYKLDGSLVTSPQAIAAPDGGWQDFGVYTDLHFLWSNDSAQVAFGDPDGNIWLSGVDGHSRALVTGLLDKNADASFSFGRSLLWSPDDTHLLVRLGEKAWVAYLSTLASAPAQPVPMLPGTPITLTALHMIDESIGWALDDGGHILRSRDGAATWRNVSPSTDFFVADGFFALDADTAWATFKSWCGGFVSDCGGHDQYVKTATVWYTTDGGRTWQAGEPLALGNAGSRPELAYYPHLYFSDAQNGWLLAWLYASHMGEMSQELFHTQDGGQTWQVAADDPMPIMGAVTQIAFQDAQTGWALEMPSYDSGKITIYQTNDGGRSWSDVANSASNPALHLYCSGGVQAHAWPLLSFQTDHCDASSLPVAYFTPDGGLSWQLLPGVASLDWLSPALGWRLIANSSNGYTLEKTTDGGASWSEIKKVIWSGQLDFVNEQAGWAVARYGEAVMFVQTTNGGKTWQEVKPVIGR